jgi:hypothetical protein
VGVRALASGPCERGGGSPGRGGVAHGQRQSGRTGEGEKTEEGESGSGRKEKGGGADRWGRAASEREVRAWAERELGRGAAHAGEEERREGPEGEKGKLGRGERAGPRGLG